MRKILAIIPARGGSKGIPKKNIASLSGKPLIIYTIEAALNSKIFSDIIVTTDSDEIAELVSKQGISTLKRPHELATDTASSIDVIDHVLKEIPKDKYDCFALLQPTSPLRNAMHIQEAWELYKKNNATTLVSVVSVSDCPQKMLAKNADNVYPITSYDDLVKPRQQLDKAYIPNGAIYICNIHNFLKTKFLFENKLVLFEMNERDSIDIDTPKDLECAENILKEIAVNKEINSNIKEMVDILSVNMAKATLLYKEEKYIQATEVFSLEEKESNFGAIQMIGVCFFKAKEFDKTIEYLSRSVSKFPTKSSKQAYLYLFNSYVQLNNDTACFEVVQEALANKKVDGRMAKAILEFLCKIEDMQYLSLITQIYPIYEKFCHENNTGIPQRFKVAYAKYNCSLNSTYNKKTIEAPKDLLDLFEVLIPTYQRKEVVISTIREIKKVNQWVHIRVIDNASTDGTYEALKKLEEEYPNLYVFQNEENIGYAGSMFRLLKDCPKKFGIFTSDEEPIIVDNTIKAIQYMVDNNIDFLSPQLFKRGTILRGGTSICKEIPKSHFGKSVADFPGVLFDISFLKPYFSTFYCDSMNHYKQVYPHVYFSILSLVFGKCSYYNLPSVYVKFTLQSTSIERNRTYVFVDERWKQTREFLNFLDNIEKNDLTIEQRNNVTLIREAIKQGILSGIKKAIIKEYPDMGDYLL